MLVLILATCCIVMKMESKNDINERLSRSIVTYSTVGVLAIILGAQIVHHFSDDSPIPSDHPNLTQPTKNQIDLLDNKFVLPKLVIE